MSLYDGTAVENDPEYRGIDDAVKKEWDDACAAISLARKVVEGECSLEEYTKRLGESPGLQDPDDGGPEFGDGPEFEGWGERTSTPPANPKQLYGDRKVGVQFVPPVAIAYLGLALQEGARKYGPFNYREAHVEAMTYVGACMRHLMAYVDGEYLDPDSGNPHLAHAMACLAILSDCTEGDTLVDNRPSPGAVAEVLNRYMKEE